MQTRQLQPPEATTEPALRRDRHQLRELLTSVDQPLQLSSSFFNLSALGGPSITLREQISQHPTGVEAFEFSQKAIRLQSTPRQSWVVHAAPFVVIAAGIVMFTIGGNAYLKYQPTPLDITPVGHGWIRGVSVEASIGSEDLAPNGEAKPIPAGKPVQLVTEIKGAPQDTPVSVVWFGPNNREVLKETHWTTNEKNSMSFVSPDTSGWETGDYRAELWVARKRVQQERFEIKQRRDTLMNTR